MRPGQLPQFPSVYREIGSRDRFTVLCRDPRQGVVEIEWISGPEKGKVRTYLLKWFHLKCEAVQ